MLAYLLAHPQFILAPLAAAGWFGFRAWQASGFKLPTLPASRSAGVTDQAAFAAVVLLEAYKRQPTKSAAVLAAIKTLEVLP